MAAAPRVLLVEDDPAIRRLVALTLEDSAIELLACATLAEARAVLAAAPVRLVICDLMLRGESGLDLLQELAGQSGLRAGARLVSFSAGIDAATRERLTGLGLWRQLAKPVAVGELLACVHDALALPAGDAPAPVGAAGAAWSAAEAAAIERHFAGNAALFLAFKASCLAQFAADRAELDAAWARRDTAALRRLGHSLKGVLRSLGHEPAAEQAQALEAAALSGDEPAVERARLALGQILASLQA